MSRWWGRLITPILRRLADDDFISRDYRRAAFSRFSADDEWFRLSMCDFADFFVADDDDDSSRPAGPIGPISASRQPMMG